MGLPLFVAPIGSDLPHKASRKAADSPSSPPRTTIQRLAHISAARQRASLNRRTRTIEHHQERLRSLAGSGSDGPNQPPVAVPATTSPTDLATVARYIRLGFMTPADLSRRDPNHDSQRAALIENMELRFGPEWRERDWEHPQQDLFSDWWIVEPRLYSGTARFTRLGQRRNASARTPAGPNHLDIVPSVSWGASQPSPPRPNPRSRPLARRRNNRMSSGSYQRPLSADMTGGLGDRDRSVSPDHWNRLLSTLMPDPQPPSLNSSFATETQLPETQPMIDSFVDGDAAADQACDSGGSDTEDNDIARHLAHIRRAMLLRTMPSSSFSRGSRAGETPIIGSVRIQMPSRDDSGSFSSTTLPLPSQSSSLRHHPLASQIDGEPPASFPLTSRGFWVGRLSVGASDDEDSTPGQQTRRRPGMSREDSGDSLSGRGNAGELTGMQRIMRNLADRQDIPDEWWAEAGLSRSLSRGDRE